MWDFIALASPVSCETKYEFELGVVGLKLSVTSRLLASKFSDMKVKLLQLVASLTYILELPPRNHEIRFEL